MGSFIRRSLITIFMAIFISVVQTYTWITLPIYYLLQKPWLKRKLNLRNRVKIYNPSSAPLTTIPSVESDSNNNNQSINKLSLSPIYIRDDCGEYNHPLYSFKTVNDIIENLTNLHGSDQPCLGKLLYLIFFNDLFDLFFFVRWGNKKKDIVKCFPKKLHSIHKVKKDEWMVDN